MVNRLQVVLEYKSGVSAPELYKTGSHPEANMFKEDTLMPPPPAL